MFKKLRKVNTIQLIIAILVFVLITISSGYMIYNIIKLDGIKFIIRLIPIIILIIVCFLFNIFIFKFLIEEKKKLLIIILVLAFIYGTCSVVIGSQVHSLFNKLSNVSSTKTSYSASIVTLKSNKVDKINKISTSDEIGIIKDTTSVNGYIIPQEIIKKEKLKNKIKEYDSHITLINDLLEGKIKYAFLPTNYDITFSSFENFKNLKEDIKIIYSLEKNIKDEISTVDVSNEPFSLLLIGVDSEKENIRESSFNGDALMLITFNPKTLSSTIVSIPRDTYTEITCFADQRKNKITHAAWYGESCMAETIEKLTGIKIDYQAKINFKGLVKLVDELGGVNIDVPFSFCEQDSNRQWGDKTIYVKKGNQLLNGEQALALSRNRHPNPDMCSSEWTDYNSNDFIRGQNQQLVIKALLNKAKDINSFKQVTSLLDTVSNNMETNMQTNQILSFYTVGERLLKKHKDTPIDELISLRRLYISGYDANIYDYSYMSHSGSEQTLYNFVPYTGSLKDISNAMKINLGLEKQELIKTMSFDINTPYEQEVIGKGNYNEAGISLMENLIGSSLANAQDYANKNNLNLTVNYKTVDSGYANNEVMEQSIHKKTDLKYARNLTITVAEVKVVEEKPEVSFNCTLEKYREDENCKIKNFENENISVFNSWKNQNNYNINWVLDTIEITDDNEINNVGIIFKQDITNGYIYDYLNKVIKISYYVKNGD